MTPEQLKRLERRLSMPTPEAIAERDRIWEKSRQYLNLPIKKWPPFEVKWTTKRDEQHFAFDGFDPVSFLEDYPEGLGIIENVPMRLLDFCLHSISRQTPREFWKVGYPSNKARVIAHFVEGKPLTPPLVCAHSGDLLLIGGGNQRLAVARVKKEKSLPILVKPLEMKEVERILTLRAELLNEENDT